MRLRGLLVIAAGLGFIAAVLVAAERQAHQLDRIEDVAGSCIVSVDACEPGDVEPAPIGATLAVRDALCEAGYDSLRYGRHTVNARPGCTRTLKRPRKTLDVLLGQDSLATQGMCDAWTAGTECPENDNCRNASTPQQFLCRCKGAGWSLTRDGVSTVEGLFTDWRGIDASACPPAAHKGCAVLLTVTRAQFHILRAIATDTEGNYPAGLKAIADAMRADTSRARRRADVPACLRPSIPVRMGRGDIEGGANFDGGAP